MLSIWKSSKFCCLVKGLQVLFLWVVKNPLCKVIDYMYVTNDKNVDMSCLPAVADNRSRMVHN